MSFPAENIRRSAVAATPAEVHIRQSVKLAGIDDCLRRWKAARSEGQTVLTGLSNALLLRTYVDNGSGSNSDGGSAVWGALASAGTTVSRVAVATEARVRRLHDDLSGLQDAMLAAAADIRRHAQEARRACCFLQTEDYPVRGATTDDAAAATAGMVKETSTGDEHDTSVIIIGGGYGLVDVADAASEVAEMLLKEALLTGTVVQGIGECWDDREALTMHMAAWMMQPYVDARRVKELETMVGGRGRA